MAQKDVTISTQERNLASNVKHSSGALKQIKKHWELYIIVFLPVLYIAIFAYGPMYGVQIAFKDFIITKGINGSPWAGFKYFEQFFNTYNFWRLIGNTLGISAVSLLVGFPAPIILAIGLNEVKNSAFKKTVQMVTYAPYFISTVVLVSMMIIFLSPQGMINRIFQLMGAEPRNYMGEAQLFWWIYALSGIWQGAGYGAVIYLAALSGIDTQLHEAAIIDGANKVQRIWHIDIPGIMPTIIILLILNAGQIMNVGFEKVFLMQNPLNLRTSEVISTYVYKTGLVGAQYSFATAVGLFNSAINLILIVTVNQIAKRVSETSLW